MKFIDRIIAVVVVVSVLLGALAVTVSAAFNKLTTFHASYVGAVDPKLTTLFKALHGRQVPVYLSFQSPGGYVTDMHYIIGYMAHMHETIEINRYVASAAAVITCYADKVVVDEHDRVLYHMPRYIDGNEVYIITESDPDPKLRAVAREFLSGVFKKCRSHLTADEYARMRAGEDIWINAKRIYG